MKAMARLLRRRSPRASARASEPGAVADGATRRLRPAPSSGNRTPAGRASSLKGDVTLTVYQPQVDKFEGDELNARAAVQVETAVEGQEKPRTTYGVVWITAHTEIDKEAGLVHLDDITIARGELPRRPEIAPTTTSGSSAVRSSTRRRSRSPASRPTSRSCGPRRAATPCRSRTIRPGSSTRRRRPCSSSWTGIRCCGPSRARDCSASSTRGRSSFTTGRATTCRS